MGCKAKTKRGLAQRVFSRLTPVTSIYFESPVTGTNRRRKNVPRYSRLASTIKTTEKKKWTEAKRNSNYFLSIFIFFFPFYFLFLFCLCLFYFLFFIFGFPEWDISFCYLCLFLLIFVLILINKSHSWPSSWSGKVIYQARWLGRRNFEQQQVCKKYLINLCLATNPEMIEKAGRLRKEVT